MPKIARDLVKSAIVKYVGEMALDRFRNKRVKVFDELQKFKKKTGLDKSFRDALEKIDNEDY